jgi:hypothetical protein
VIHLSSEVSVAGLDHIPNAEVVSDQIWLQRDLVGLGLSVAEACRAGLALAFPPCAGGLFLWKWDKEEACYFDPGRRTSLADPAQVMVNRSPARCRIH